MPLEAPPPRAMHAMHAMHGQAPPRAEAPPPEIAVDPGASSPMPVLDAVAVLVPTKGNRVSGVVRFHDDGHGVEVTASVTGLPAGAHAYHVHVYGDCSSPDAQSAGPHFHFQGSSFDPETIIITGDLGELRGDGRPVALDRTRVNASLQGRFSIIGRAVVVHERGNDPASPPDGAAGKRLACGVIGASGAAPAAPLTARRP
jgi:Cu-Zn family superoxide dismutase